MKETIILGNIITMDEKRPFAKAISAARRRRNSSPLRTRRYWITARTTSIPAFWSPTATAIWPAIAPSGRRTSRRWA